MKPVFYFFIFFCLLLYSACENSSGNKTASAVEEPSAAKTDSSLLQKAFIAQCSKLEITPVDDSGKDTSLLRMITYLKNIVAKKDTALLFDLMSPDIVSSHGGLVIGKEEFIEHWHLQNDPAASELWPELKRAIDLGGCFDKRSDGNEFVMPYLQAGHYFENGCDFDWFITYVCLSPETKVYEKPDKKSKILAKLKYRMLRAVTMQNRSAVSFPFTRSIKRCRAMCMSRMFTCVRITCWS